MSSGFGNISATLTPVVAKKALVQSGMIYGTLGLSIIGFIGNFLILLVTFKTKTLRNRCNFLLSILAFSDIIITLYLIQLRVFMLLDIYLISNSFCYYTSIYGLFALNVQAGIGLVISLDRYIAVQFPFAYNRIELNKYLVLVSVPVITYASVITCLGYFDSSTSVITPVCMPPTAYNSLSRMIWIGSNMVIVVLVIFVYFNTWLIIKKSSKSSDSLRNNVNFRQVKKVLSSLILIMLIYSSTWALTVIALLITQIFAPGTILSKTIEQQLAWLVIINASTNFFIYMWRTKDYRDAFLIMIGYTKKAEIISQSRVTFSKAQMTKC
uniref:G_PROTEIN_RECEP_F1_2 domain-containing protein n=1 Tax=Rhabditophanes sp. KR3021 TaxID=114890 RepID=A0AC35TM26_9BILA